MVRAALLAVVLLLAGRPTAACLASDRPAAPVTILGVDRHGDLLASDGGRLRIEGLSLPPESRVRASTLVAGAAAAVGAGVDRWGRRTLAGPPGLALELVGAGLAVTLASDAAPDCLALFLAAEERARRDGRGIWSEGASRPIDARRGDAVQARAGHYVLAEGRIAHVGWTRRAAYLNFGRPGEGASAELPGAVWRALERQGWTRESLRGKHVRVRGVASAGRRGRVLVDGVAAIEWLD